MNISLCKREQTWEEWATLSDLNDDKKKTAGPVCVFLRAGSSRVETFTNACNSKKEAGRLLSTNYFIQTRLKEYKAAPDTLNAFFLLTWKAWQACKSKKCQPSYLFLVPHHGIFHFGSHLHVPSPGLGHLSLKTHSDRDTEGGHGVSDGVMRRAGGGPRPLYLVGRCVMRAGGKTRASK